MTPPAADDPAPAVLDALRALGLDVAVARRRPLAPAPLVYADLVATGHPRCLDAAARLRSADDLLRHLDGS